MPVSPPMLAPPLLLLIADEISGAKTGAQENAIGGQVGRRQLLGKFC
jgi:hypothetical protein